MVGVASSGSSKAYILPSIVHIKNRVNLKKGDGPIASISAPTKKLAQQTKDVADKYGTVSRIRSTCVFGGSPNNETEHKTCTMKQITLKYLLTAVLIFFLAAVFLQFSNALSQSNLLADEWHLFKARYKKEYPSQLEEEYRMKIFFENKHKIAKHNILYDKGEKSYQVAMNQFGDLHHCEFKCIMMGYLNKKRNLSFAKSTYTFMEPANVAVPESVDWREKGAVTSVKYQGRCGSCWAFSAIGALEGQTFRKTGKLISLSEQNLIDCSREHGNLGCKGGRTEETFQYIKDNKGIDTENEYHYEAKENLCRDNQRKRSVVALGFVDIPSGEEDKLKAAVATVGPVSVAIDASHKNFQFYSKGVYYEPSCRTSSKHLSHSVLVIGYGSDNGKDYWLVKNSWSENWGDEGYLKIARNRNNHCGIATRALYPIV
ncbi:procathepsin L-like [Artemia franciscana]